MQIGYARVSTQDQDLRLQYEALRQAQCDKIYEDKASGAQASREGLKLALDILRENDTLVVWKLDRLGRRVRDLVNIVSDLEQRGVSNVNYFVRSHCLNSFATEAKLLPQLNVTNMRNRLWVEESVERPK